MSKTPYKRLSVREQKKVIKQYLSGKSCETIAKSFNVNRVTIGNILRRNNVKIRTSFEALKLPVDHNYFETIDSEEKAYWLGYFICDGCVHKNICTIRLCGKDVHHLKRFKNALKAEHKIGEGIYGEHSFGQLQIKSEKLVYDLSKYGVIPRKTGKEILPLLNQDLMRHLIRGIVDGDGCLTYKKSYNNTKRLDFDLNICSASLQFLKDIKKYINDIFGERFGYLETKKKPPHYNPYYSLHFSGNQKFMMLCEWLYTDSNIHLERKKIRYDLCKNQDIYK